MLCLQRTCTTADPIRCSIAMEQVPHIFRLWMFPSNECWSGAIWCDGLRSLVLHVSPGLLDDRAPKKLAERKIAACRGMCCNIALLALVWNSAGTLKRSVNACDRLHILSCLGHSELVVRLLVSELVGWLWWNQNTRSTSTLMQEMLNSQFNWRRCSFQFPGVQMIFWGSFACRRESHASNFWMLPEILHCFQLYPAFCWGKNADVESSQIKHYFKKSWRLLKYKEHMKDIHPDHVYRL